MKPKNLILPWIESSHNVGFNKHRVAFPLQQQGGLSEHLGWNNLPQMCHPYSEKFHKHKIDKEPRLVFDLTKAVFNTIATFRVGPCDCATGADDAAGTALETTFVVEN